MGLLPHELRRNINVIIQDNGVIGSMRKIEKGRIRKPLPRPLANDFREVHPGALAVGKEHVWPRAT